MIKPLQPKVRIAKRNPIFDKESAWANRDCQVVDMHFRELIRFYQAITHSDKTVREAEYSHWEPRSRNTASKLYAQWGERNGFYGGTVDDMHGYIKNGYKTGAMLGDFLPGVLRTREGSAQRGRWVWQDSGDEVDVGLALAGDSQPFRSFEPSPTTGGLNINVLMSFAASTDFEVIAQYGSWIARLLATCSGAGVSPALTIDQYCGYLADACPFGLVRLRVKQENEALGWHRYSSLFSPTGYRHLCFAAMLRAGGDPLLMTGDVDSGLGNVVSPGDKWTLHWDTATRALTVYGPSHPRSFDEASLNEQLINSGALTPKGIYA